MKLGLALLTKDHPELTRRSIEPLLQPGKFDLWNIDGSDKPLVFGGVCAIHGVRGGPDAAIVCALTHLLEFEHGYTHVGLCEQDVLLDKDWFAPTMELFKQGEQDGLDVGAVSARAYEDRILIQRDGYGLMHNLGAGMAIFTRDAARLILDNYRTGWAPDNRSTFLALSGVDIGGYWAFRGGEHALTADWHFDVILARHGLTSLALTPSRATMLDQDIAAQGLKMADGTMDVLRNNLAFDRFCAATKMIRGGWLDIGGNSDRILYCGGYVYFPHQLHGLNSYFSFGWRLKNSQAYGPFALQAAEQTETGCGCYVNLMVQGPCEVNMTGPGKVRVTDTGTGLELMPELPAEFTSIMLPSGPAHRLINIVAVTPGVQFHGIRTRDRQPWMTSYAFDYMRLPKP